MTTTLTLTSGQVSFAAQGYVILPSGTAVPDSAVQNILLQAQQAQVTITSSAGTGVSFAPSRRFVSTGTGAPTSGAWLIGDQLQDSAGNEYECLVSGTPGTWQALGGGGLSLPSQTGQAGKVLGTDGTSANWTSAGSGAVSSVAGRTGAVTLAKADVGLGNVDNTSDVNKPVSTAQAAAFLPAVRTVAASYSATVAPNSATTDVLNVGVLTGNLTLANPTGSPTDGQTLRVRLVQDGTGSRIVSFGTGYAFGTDITTSLIPSAASSKWEMLFAWHAGDSKWRALSIVRGF